MEDYKMKIFAKIVAVFCLTGFAFAQSINVQAGVAGQDLVDALAAVNGGAVIADTLLLVTDGGIYELDRGDTISVPMVIKAADGLTNKPIIRSSAGNDLDRFFEVWADLTLEGIILDGERTDGTLNAFGEDDMISGVQNPDESWGRFDLTIRDCELRNVYTSGDPALGAKGNIFSLNTDGFLGNFIVEGSIFSNVIDEALIMQNAMKTTEFGGGRPADTVIVRNCTFINCGGPVSHQGCFTIKGDDDTTTADAKIILENLTFYNSGPNCIYSRESEGMEIRNIVIAFTLEGGDNDNLIRTDRDGSIVSHVDTFAIGPLLDVPFKVGPGSNTGAGMATLDTATIYGFDPAFTDAPNGDLTLLATSEICGLGSDGGALGDSRWATNCPTAAVDEGPITPTAFSLSQNYPNPFNPATTINYTLESRTAVKLEIFDLTGSRVATLVDGVGSVGSHSIAWDASSMASGIYFYKLTADGHSMTRKMMYLK